MRYKPGGKFKAHLDAFVNHATGEIDDAVRISTNIVYLNDGYGGGETAFLRPQIKVGGLTGDLLHFRNLTDQGDIDQEAIHAGMPVTYGEKWVIVQWGQRGPIDRPG